MSDSNPAAGPPISREHAALLRHANIRWIPGPCGAPGLDPKRPYGNSDVTETVHEILAGGYPTGDLPEDVKDQYRELHRGTEQALRDLIEWALGGHFDA